MVGGAPLWQPKPDLSNIGDHFLPSFIQNNLEEREKWLDYVASLAYSLGTKVKTSFYIKKSNQVDQANLGNL